MKLEQMLSQYPPREELFRPGVGEYKGRTITAQVTRDPKSKLIVYVVPGSARVLEQK